MVNDENNNKDMGKKEIFVSAESTKELHKNEGVGDVYANGVNDCINKSIIMIDKYLFSLGL